MNDGSDDGGMWVDGTPSDPPPVPPFSDSPDTPTHRIYKTSTVRYDEWFEIVTSIQNETKRGILTAIHHGVGAATLGEIETYTSVTQRNVRENIRRLEREGVLKRYGENFPTIELASEEIEVLVAHELDRFYNQ